MAALAGRELAADLELRRLVQQAARPAQQHGPGRRRLDAARMAAQQGDAEALLQFRHALADGRGRDVLPRGGAGDARLLDDGDEQPGRDEVEMQGCRVVLPSGASRADRRCPHGE
jgi:hypothetical protein